MSESDGPKLLGLWPKTIATNSDGQALLAILAMGVAQAEAGRTRPMREAIALLRQRPAN